MAGLVDVPMICPSLVCRRLVNIPRNWNLGRNDLKRIKAVIKNNGIISVHGYIHAPARLGNGITPENIRKLEAVLNYLEGEYHDAIWYATFGEVASYFRKVVTKQ